MNDEQSRRSGFGRRQPVFLNTKKAAALLTLSPRTLEKMRICGTGPRYRKHGGVVRYLIEDLEEWSSEHSRIRTPNRKGQRNA